MDTEWMNRVLACFFLVLLLSAIIFFIISEQPSLRAFLIIAISYGVGLPLGQYFFQRLAVSPSFVQRQLTPGQTQIVGLITLALIISLLVIGGKQLAGDVVAGLFALLCGVATYAIAYYWRTRPR
jgi:hypothetical protein